MLVAVNGDDNGTNNPARKKRTNNDKIVAQLAKGFSLNLIV